MGRSSRKSSHALTVWKTILTWSKYRQDSVALSLVLIVRLALDPNRHMHFVRSDLLRMINAACASQALTSKNIWECQRE